MPQAQKHYLVGQLIEAFEAKHQRETSVQRPHVSSHYPCLSLVVALPPALLEIQNIPTSTTATCVGAYAGSAIRHRLERSCK